MNITHYQKLVDCWIKKEGVKYFSPMTNMALLTEEVGELARIMARLHGDQTFKEGEENLSLEDELADILWVVTAIANQSGIDLVGAITKNLEKKSSRDKNRYRGASK